MSSLAESYKACRQISRLSGSNFYAAFSILSGDRRRAMDALYAFARLADDASDSQLPLAQWSAAAWHDWIHQLSESGSTSDGLLVLEPIRLAVADSVKRFEIPLSVFHDLVEGIEFDLASTVRISTWDELRRYCMLVASSVGRGCLSIWLKECDHKLSDQLVDDAAACGIAFQLTNILRDIVEDTQRNRCYLPSDDMDRLGIEPSQWMSDCRSPNSKAEGRYVDLVKIYCEKALGHYEKAMRIKGHLCQEGQRMFSLMWSTYRTLLAEIQRNPEQVFAGRISIPRNKKWRLAFQHFVTPAYRRLSCDHNLIRDKLAGKLTSKGASGRDDKTLRVAIVGGGLAGCNAALHLARHGLSVDLFEARSRLGGRVGSFFDRDSNMWVDYCQHVGMKCCSELQRWILETEQQNDWDEQKSLHFVSSTGQRIEIQSLPLPPPFHLATLLWKWPDLKFSDRIRVAWALHALTKLHPKPEHESILALDWLNSMKQSERALTCFWETILVSALGEQVDRVTLGAVRKVLVDGFARTRDAFHLLVPNRPLSELVDGQMKRRLIQAGVSIHQDRCVTSLEKDGDDLWTLGHSHSSTGPYQAVVVAVPWHQVEKLIPQPTHLAFTPGSMASSPISGVHTWWDRPWLKEKHAILIGGLCQWVFPAMDRENSDVNSTYYQIVISASRQLPKGNQDAVLKAVVEDLAKTYPDSQHAKMLRGKVVTDPQAVFSVTPKASECRWSTDRSEATGLFYAGDWTDTKWPATMEGALRSGVAAAESVLFRLGRPARIS